MARKKIRIIRIVLSHCGAKSVVPLYTTIVGYETLIRAVFAVWRGVVGSLNPRVD